MNARNLKCLLSSLPVVMLCLLPVTSLCLAQAPEPSPPVPPHLPVIPDLPDIPDIPDLAPFSFELEGLHEELAGLGHQLQFELAPILPDLPSMELAPHLEELLMGPELGSLPELGMEMQSLAGELAGPFLQFGEPFQSMVLDAAFAFPFGGPACQSPFYSEHMTENERLKAIALSALLRQDEEAGIEETKRILAQHSNWAMRAHAMRLLAHTRSGKAVEVLKHALKDSDQRVRRAAVAALSQRSEPEARAALQELLKSQ